MINLALLLAAFAFLTPDAAQQAGVDVPDADPTRFDGERTAAKMKELDGKRRKSGQAAPTTDGEDSILLDE